MKMVLGLRLPLDVSSIEPIQNSHMTPLRSSFAMATSLDILCVGKWALNRN